MCAVCEGGASSGVGIQAAVLARARVLDRQLPGQVVTDEAWDILAGRRGGAIVWAEYQRMLQCLDAATAEPSRRGLVCM